MIKIKHYVGIKCGFFWNEVFFEIAHGYKELHSISQSYDTWGYIEITCNKKLENLCNSLLESMR